jgi:AcrR family transcriptional regulator
MASSVKRRRAYRSVLRAEQAQLTRLRITGAARALFLDQGYASTSISSIATAAGVAPETVYDVFGTKRRVLEAVVELGIAGGPEEPREILDRAWVREIAALGSFEERLSRFAEHTADTVARMSGIHAVIRSAANGDTELAELYGRIQETRFRSQRRVMVALSGGIENGQTLAAAETFSALASPELQHLLTVTRRWSLARYRAWLKATVVAAIARQAP